MSNPRWQPNRRKYFLSGGQAKLDVNKDGKLSSEDFKKLRSKNKKIKIGKSPISKIIRKS